MAKLNILTMIVAARLLLIVVAALAIITTSGTSGALALALSTSCIDSASAIKRRTHHGDADNTNAGSSSSSSASTPLSSRREWLVSQAPSRVVAAAAATACLLTSTTVLTQPQPAYAAENTNDANTNSYTNKLVNLSKDDFTNILKRDIVDNQFLVTGKLSREIYDESCTFTNEIDTYGMDEWIKGTSKLFVGNKSSLRLVGPIVFNDDNTLASFLFDEDLVFNLPLLLQPVVHLTGQLLLQRDPTTGLITSYREKWDQSVVEVLKSARL